MMIKDCIKKYKYDILIVILILVICSMHILFLLQMDYAVYDHGQWRTGRVAIDAYWLLKDGRIKDFVVEMFGCWHDSLRYPNMIGYLMAVPCYFFGLNELVMRSTMLLFYVVLILYIYLCGKELASKKTGILAALIATTMPMLVFWSRMINTNFFGALFFIMAFYHMLMSRSFRRFGHSVLFGLFSGLALLTHRVMFFYVITLWIIVSIYFVIRGNIGKAPIRNYFSGLIFIFAISSYFIKTWIHNGEPGGNLLSFVHTYPFSRITNAIYIIPRLLGELGWDNIFVIILAVIIFHLFKKDTFKKRDVTLLFYTVVISFGMLITFYCIRPGYSLMHFVIITPIFAILTAIYLSELPRALQIVFVFMKCLLLVYLSLTIIPRFVGKDNENIFYNYYKNSYSENGSGVIWSNMTYAREEELDYFCKEISEGDIAIIDLSNGSVGVPLGFRLKVNGIGRSIDADSADIRAYYLMFYCISLNNIKALQDYRWRRDFAEKDNLSALLVVEKFLNDNVSEELRPDERIAMMDGYIFLSDIKRYIEKYHFVKTKFFKFHFKNIPMYKVVFKCTERVSELRNFYGYGKQQCLITGVGKWDKKLTIL